MAVVIPCFNAENWIAQAIDSCLSQTVTPSEVVVVDNRSTDRSPEIVKEYEDKILYLKCDRGNGNAARNLGWRATTTEWVQFLDADDWLLPHKLEANLAASSPSTDVVYSPVREYHCSPNSLPNPGDQVPYSEEEDHFLRWIRWKVCQTGGVLWRRRALETLSGWNEEFDHCQDNEICFRALTRRLRFTLDPDTNTAYRVHGEDTVSRRDPNSVCQTKSSLQLEMFTWLKNNELLTASHSQALGQALFENARQIARADIPSAAALLSRVGKQLPLSVTGPAAPRAYQLIYSVFGFRAAEIVARFLR